MGLARQTRKKSEILIDHFLPSPDQSYLCTSTGFCGRAQKWLPSFDGKGGSHRSLMDTKYPT